MAKKKLPLIVPNFLIIGAPEAGGDIIKQALLKNPKIWFPPLDNILAFHSAFQLERIQIAQNFIKAKVPLRQLKNIRWLLRYFLQPVPTRKWYSKLLKTKEQDLVKGEFSDEYITLPFDEVENLHRIMPDCKIVLLLRNPVDRSFASIRKKFRNNKETPFNKLSKRQLLALMNSDWARTHSAYQSALDCWPVFFPLKNIFIGYYDDLINDPNAYMARLNRFLELEDAPAQDMSALLPPPQKPFPDSLLAELHPLYRHELENLSDRLHGHADSWLEKFNAATTAKAQSQPLASAATDN